MGQSETLCHYGVSFEPLIRSSAPSLEVEKKGPGFALEMK